MCFAHRSLRPNSACRWNGAWGKFINGPVFCVDRRSKSTQGCWTLTVLARVEPGTKSWYVKSWSQQQESLRGDKSLSQPAWARLIHSYHSTGTFLFKWLLSRKCVKQRASSTINMFSVRTGRVLCIWKFIFSWGKPMHFHEQEGALCFHTGNALFWGSVYMLLPSTRVPFIEFICVWAGVWFHQHLSFTYENTKDLRKHSYPGVNMKIFFLSDSSSH